MKIEVIRVIKVIMKKNKVGKPALSNIATPYTYVRLDPME